MFKRLIGKILVILCHYKHFFIEHNHGHHLHVSIPEDRSNTQYNQSLYSFWFQPIPITYTIQCLIQKKYSTQTTNRSYPLKMISFESL
jgi:alkane 1-monooxygenase